MSLMDKKTKILITGGQGRIGKELGSYLAEQGFSEVHALAGTKEGIDLGEDATVAWAFDLNPEVVVHLATRLPSKENCLDYPAGMMYENIFVTTKILEEARRSGCKKFIMAWDSSCYPERQILPYKEKDLWEGSPYWNKRYYGNAAKVMMELNMAFSTQFEDFIGINLIFPEVYGPRSRFNPRRNFIIENVISNIALAHKEGEGLKIEATNKSSRDFIYIDDAVKAIYHAIEYSEVSNTYNASQGSDISIRSLHAKVAEIMGYQGKVDWIETDLDTKERTFLDISLIKKELGWVPRVDMQEGLERTIQWHNENLIPNYVSEDSILVR
tara:strand:- start:1802 stop:2782 length:981 start_codon:yes stop_codon:yes gene_type:complete